MDRNSVLRSHFDLVLAQYVRLPPINERTARKAIDDGNAMLVKLALSSGAKISTHPDRTMLDLGGIKIVEAYGSPGVIHDWLRKCGEKLGFDHLHFTYLRETARKSLPIDLASAGGA